MPQEPGFIPNANNFFIISQRGCDFITHGSVYRYITSHASHSYTDISGFQGRRVIHAVYGTVRTVVWEDGK